MSTKSLRNPEAKDMSHRLEERVKENVHLFWVLRKGLHDSQGDKEHRYDKHEEESFVLDNITCFSKCKLQGLHFSAFYNI